MSNAWHFNEARPGDRARESQVEKFFNSDAVTNRANAIVREGIQNSLDAAPDDVVVRVRIGLGRWSEQQKDDRLERYTTGFFDHFDAEAVRTKIVNPPTTADAMRYLVFEDFGTSGLLGDPAQCFLNEQHKPNAFFNYFRAEGISDKDQGNRGRHGVGKFVFLAASLARVVFGLTRRDDDRELLLGTTVLRNHWLNHKPYIADGWFGIPDPAQAGNILPIEGDGDFIDRFKSNFQLSRLNETGLSVVVPWLIEEVTVTEVIAAVVRQYFHPILRKKLVVEVVDESGDLLLIDAETIKSVIETQNGELATVMQPFIALAEASFAITDPLTLAAPAAGARRWLAESLSDEVRAPMHETLETGELVTVRVPMQIRLKEDGSIANSHFDISMRRDASINEGQILFIREGIIISDVRPGRTAGIRALVVIDEGPLATFLGDAENPSHTQWQKELVRDKYSYHAANIDYVVQSVPRILALLSEEQKKPDASLLIDLFSLPADDAGPKIKEKRKKKKEGTDPDEPEIDVQAKPKSYVIEKLADGFKICAGDPGAPRPPMLAIKVAYGVRRGSPFSRYNTADFRLGLGGIECLCKGCELTDFADNWMNVEITDEDFEIDVTGFDTNRDLHIDAKVTEKEVADVATS